MVEHKLNPLAWDINLEAKQDPNIVLESKRKQYELDLLYYSVFSTEAGQKLLANLHEIVVNRIGYSAAIPYEKAVANMLIRDGQAMLVQAFEAGVEKIKKASTLEEYAKL